MKSSRGILQSHQLGLIPGLFAYILRKLNKRPFLLSSFQETQSHSPTSASNQKNQPKVSIIIPTRDKSDLLSKCVDSVRKKTKYSNYEILIVNNMSSDASTLFLLESYQKNGIRVIDFSQPFNYSKICNLAAAESDGEMLCFLNNDTEILSQNWLSSMVDHASEGDTGVVGAVLTYPDGSIQHMGVALGYTGVAGHPYRGLSPDECLPTGCYEVSCVTFACAVVSKRKFQEIGGLDENYPFGFNDIDFCVRSTNAGYKNGVCLEARLTHSESQTRKRTLNFSGAIQAAKDVLRFLRNNQPELKDSFFSTPASE
jgi:GT2 family glycosyltransferase